MKIKGKTYSVVWVACTGEAHANPYIDHCSVCMPYWGEYPTCSVCGLKLLHRKRVWNGFRFYCTFCRAYLLDAEKPFIPLQARLAHRGTENAAAVTVSDLETKYVSRASYDALRLQATRAELDLELHSADYKQLLMDVEQLREENTAHKGELINRALEIQDLLTRAEKAEADAERLAKANRWIPVSERLPEEPGQYIVAVDLLRPHPLDWNTRDVYECVYSEVGWHTANDVIAWMPLPEPPAHDAGQGG